MPEGFDVKICALDALRDERLKTKREIEDTTRKIHDAETAVEEAQGEVGRAGEAVKNASGDKEKKKKRERLTEAREELRDMKYELKGLERKRDSAKGHLAKTEAVADNVSKTWIPGCMVAHKPKFTRLIPRRKR